MKDFKPVTIQLMLAVLLIPFTLQAAPRSTPVTVVNDAGNPVPVTGTVVTNVVGTPGVTIENGPLEPVPVSHERFPREPLVITASAFIPANSIASPTIDAYTVPTDQIFVLQSVSSYACCPERLDYVEVRSNRGSGPGFSFQFPAQSSHSGKSTAVNVQVTAYFQPNAEVSVRVGLPVRLSYDLSSGVQLHGYLVAVTSPSLAP